MDRAEHAKSYDVALSTVLNQNAAPIEDTVILADGKDQTDQFKALDVADGFHDPGRLASPVPAAPEPGSRIWSDHEKSHEEAALLPSWCLTGSPRQPELG
jgi:hypothetical protein